MTIGNLVTFGQTLADMDRESWEAFTGQQVRGAIRNGDLTITDYTKRGDPIVGLPGSEVVPF